MTSQPLELRVIPPSKPCPNGATAKELPAIHAAWADLDYPWTGLPAHPNDGLTVDAWHEAAAFTLDDLQRLLSLPYHRFWSQLVHDKTVHSFIDSLLLNLPRPFDQGRPPSSAILETIAKKTFLLFVRMSTHKESPKDYISPAKFGEIVYDNFLFDIPRMMDVCSLFYFRSPTIVAKMITNIFSQQPRFIGDLKGSLETILSGFQSLSERVEVLTRQSSSIENHELEDLIIYATDIALTLSSLCQAYPPCCKVLKEMNFETSLSTFYQQSLVTLNRYVIKAKNSGQILNQETFDQFLSSLCLARKHCVDIVRQMILVTCLSPVKSEEEAHCETYLDICTTLLAEGTLLLDYSRRHSLQNDIVELTQIGKQPDALRVQYILDGVEALQSDSIQNVRKGKEREEHLTSVNQELIDRSEIAVALSSQPTESKDVSGTDFDGLISQVKDLLPDLGAGFVLECLQYYDKNPEKVVNAILEDNLPPHISQMDRQTALEKERSQRQNVFDGDEFDIGARDKVDLSRVHKGKRRVPKDASSMLSDKSSIDKERYAPLGIVVDEEEIQSAGTYDAAYDDEYDDTYDDNAVGQSEPDADMGRPFVLPQALGGGHIAKVIEEEEEVQQERDKKQMDFVRNPEEVRAEAERRRQTKANQSKKTGSTPASTRTKDVVGKPKGQGQEKQVLINRARKNTNKGKSHRAAAERKQAKGMY